MASSASRRSISLPRWLVLRDLFHRPAHDPEMKELATQRESDPLVTEILSLQNTTVPGRLVCRRRAALQAIASGRRPLSSRASDIWDSTALIARLPAPPNFYSVNSCRMVLASGEVRYRD